MRITGRFYMQGGTSTGVTSPIFKGYTNINSPSGNQGRRGYGESSPAESPPLLLADVPEHPLFGDVVLVNHIVANAVGVGHEQFKAEQFPVRNKGYTTDGQAHSVGTIIRRRTAAAAETYWRVKRQTQSPIYSGGLWLEGDLEDPATLPNFFESASGTPTDYLPSYNVTKFDDDANFGTRGDYKFAPFPTLYGLYGDTRLPNDRVILTNTQLTLLDMTAFGLPIWIKASLAAEWGGAGWQAANSAYIYPYGTNVPPTMTNPVPAGMFVFAPDATTGQTGLFRCASGTYLPASPSGLTAPTWERCNINRPAFHDYALPQILTKARLRTCSVLGTVLGQDVEAYERYTTCTVETTFADAYGFERGLASGTNKKITQTFSVLDSGAVTQSFSGLPNNIGDHPLKAPIEGVVCNTGAIATAKIYINGPKNGYVEWSGQPPSFVNAGEHILIRRFEYYQPTAPTFSPRLYTDAANTNELPTNAYYEASVTKSYHFTPQHYPLPSNGTPGVGDLIAVPVGQLYFTGGAPANNPALVHDSVLTFVITDTRALDRVGQATYPNYGGTDRNSYGSGLIKFTSLEASQEMVWKSPFTWATVQFFKDGVHAGTTVIDPMVLVSQKITMTGFRGYNELKTRALSYLASQPLQAGTFVLNTNGNLTFSGGGSQSFVTGFCDSERFTVEEAAFYDVGAKSYLRKTVPGPICTCETFNEVVPGCPDPVLQAQFGGDTSLTAYTFALKGGPCV